MGSPEQHAPTAEETLALDRLSVEDEPTTTLLLSCDVEAGFDGRQSTFERREYTIVRSSVPGKKWTIEYVGSFTAWADVMRFVNVHMNMRGIVKMGD